MKTTENTQNHRNFVPKVKFLEYATADSGQHLITVLQGRTVIGRIYREFDTTTKKPVYTANDAMGNSLFTEEQSLAGLKKSFVQIVQTQKEIQSPEQESVREAENTDKEISETLNPDSTKNRQEDLQKLRTKTNNPEKKNEISR